MNAIPQNGTKGGALLVPAKEVARQLSCTPRYVHMLHERGEIPGHRIGPRMVRFRLPEVLAALGLDFEVAESATGAQK